MDIEVLNNEQEVIISLKGRLDTNTAPVFEEEVKKVGVDVATLVLDFNDLSYISSAGLRVILAAQKKMNKQGIMLVKHVCDDILEVLDITGFRDILTIEEEKEN